MAKSIYQILVEIEGNEKAKQSLTQLGQAAGLAGAALTAFSGFAAKAAADYEYSLAKVGTLATEATGSTEEFDAALLKLSQDMDGAISIADAAAASYDILSAGYSDQADVLAILEASQKTATGGFSDLATVSDAATTVMNAFGDALGENLSVSEKVKAVTDGMIATQNAGKITADQYAAQIGRIASTAAAAGVSLEEVNAAVATATAQGVKVESTFAGLGQVMAAIMKPTAEAADLAEELGIQFDAAALQSMGLSGVLQQLIDGGLKELSEEVATFGENADLTQVMGQLSAESQATAENMTKLFGSVEAVKVLMPLVSNDAAAFNKNLEAMGNTAGTVDEAFTKMSATTQERVASVMNKLNNTLIKLGQGIVIAIEPAISAIEWLVENVSTLPEPFLQFGGAIILATGGLLSLAGAITMATAAYGTLNATMGTMLGLLGLKNISVAALSVKFKGLAASAGLANVSMGKMVVTLGLAAAAVGVWAVAIENIRDQSSGLNSAIDEMRDAARGAAEEMESLADETERLADIEPSKDWGNLWGLHGTKRLNDFRVKVGEVSDSAYVLIDQINALGDSQEDNARKAKLYESGLAGIDDAISQLDERKLGTEVYEELKGQLEATKTTLEATARAHGIAGGQAQTQAGATDELTGATEQLTNATAQLTEEEQARLDQQKEITQQIEDQIEQRQQDLALSKQKEAQLDAITKATEEQTAAIEAQRDAEIDALKDARAQDREQQKESYESQVEDFKDARETERLELKEDNEARIESLKDRRDEARRNADRDHAEAMDALKESREDERRNAEEQHSQKIEGLKDARAQSRQDAERALAEEISGRLEAQAESFTGAQRALSEYGKLAAAETEEERDRLAREFAEQRRMEEEAAALDLADKVYSSSELLRAAADVAGVGPTINTEEEAKKVQYALAEIERQQKEQQAEADRQKQEALAEQQRQLDLATEQQIADFEKAFNDQQRQLDKETEAEIQAANQSFEDEQRQLDKDAEAEIQALKKAFDEQEREAERAFQAEMEAREKAFKEEQRALDLESAEQIKAIQQGADVAIAGVRERGAAQAEAVTAAFDQQAFVEDIRRQAESAELTASEVQRLTELANAGNITTQAQLDTSGQNLQTLQGMAIASQQQATLSENAQNYLNAQVSELQRLNTTNLSILDQVMGISGKLDTLPGRIVQVMPRPSTVAIAGR